ncbi:flavin reductase family protein [Brevibacterium daeguense]|uniref:Flavin reductase family protein n=2 Tax=Brevibacterium daeguense TaxID=909936 RepID=A0ABP8EF70_9MICO
MSEYKDVSPQRMREVMGSFCSGVTVVATQTEDGPVGFTCQSFTSLSLEPALITFNPSRTSTSWPRIREVGRFCVNILGGKHQELSGGFARSGADKFAGVAHEPTPLGNLRLVGALAWIDCTLHAEYDGGDHTIVVGQVQAMEAAQHIDPLLFYRGRYAALAAAIELAAS